MKKVVFFLTIGLVVGLGISASAQKKTGYINANELMESMPEAKKADSAYQKFSQELEDQLEVMYKEYQTKIKDYDGKSATWSEAVRETKEKELRDLQNRIQEFQQGAEAKVGKRRQDLFKPVLEKAQNAIKAVGTEGGYDYIFDGSQLLYAKEGENIMPLVKAKLGIK